MKLHLNDNDYLVIDVRHRVGGTNYFTYKNEERGVEVSFAKKTISEDRGYSTTTYTPMSDGNFRILAIPTQRKSQKKINEVDAYVRDHKEELLSLWLKNDKASIYEMITKRNSNE